MLWRTCSDHFGRCQYILTCSTAAVCRYFLVGPTAQQTRSYDWLRDHLPKDGSVQLSDVTSMYTALDVIGPKAKELLSELTDTPLGKQDFVHMTCKVRPWPYIVVWVWHVVRTLQIGWNQWMRRYSSNSNRILNWIGRTVLSSSFAISLWKLATTFQMQIECYTKISISTLAILFVKAYCITFCELCKS